mgnify:CR=1 FL=1
MPCSLIGLSGGFFIVNFRDFFIRSYPYPTPRLVWLLPLSILIQKSLILVTGAARSRAASCGLGHEMGDKRRKKVCHKTVAKLLQQAERIVRQKI